MTCDARTLEQTFTIGLDQPIRAHETLFMKNPEGIVIVKWSSCVSTTDQHGRRTGVSFSLTVLGFLNIKLPCTRPFGHHSSLHLVFPQHLSFSISSGHHEGPRHRRTSYFTSVVGLLFAITLIGTGIVYHA
jgi:hypothetical protein